MTSYTEETIKDVILAGLGDHATKNSRTLSEVSSFQRQKKRRSNVEDKSLHVSSRRCNKLF